jgi:hypothetical protein
VTQEARSLSWNLRAGVFPAAVVFDANAGWPRVADGPLPAQFFSGLRAGGF